MTKMKLKNGETVYSELPVHEIRSYLFGSSKAGTFDGYLDETKATSILIAVHAIVYIYK